MPIAQRRKADLCPFREATSSLRAVAALYFFKQLDPYLESAPKIPMGLFDRPLADFPAGSRHD